MHNTKVDPRIIRTRKLLMDAFSKLIQKKGFKDITIKDITDEANVNRATFYAHFQDKYDLIDVGITKEILDSIVKRWDHFNKLNEKTIVGIFLTLTEFHTKKYRIYRPQCRKSMEPFNSIIEQKIKKELGELFHSLLLKQQHNMSSEDLKIVSTIFSWGIYGASVDWENNSSLSAEQYIKKALPFIVSEKIILKDD